MIKFLLWFIRYFISWWDHLTYNWNSIGMSRFVLLNDNEEAWDFRGSRSSFHYIYYLYDCIYLYHTLEYGSDQLIYCFNACQPGNLWAKSWPTAHRPNHEEASNQEAGLRQAPSAHCKILLPALSTFHSSRRALRHWCIRAMLICAVSCWPCCGRPALAAFFLSKTGIMPTTSQLPGSARTSLWMLPRDTAKVVFRITVLIKQANPI